jgi:hypothetical protein
MLHDFLLRPQQSAMSLAEAKRVMTDDKHSLFARYRQGDPLVVEAVDRAFQKTWGTYQTEIEIISADK